MVTQGGNTTLVIKVIHHLDIYRLGHFIVEFIKACKHRRNNKKAFIVFILRHNFYWRKLSFCINQILTQLNNGFFSEFVKIMSELKGRFTFFSFKNSIKIRKIFESGSESYF
jgi:hypothetical protein